jgi:hypothetical protein
MALPIAERSARNDLSGLTEYWFDFGNGPDPRYPFSASSGKTLATLGMIDDIEQRANSHRFTLKVR